MIVGLLRRDYLLSRLTHYFCIFYNQQEQYRKKLTWLQAVCRMKSCNIHGFQMGILLAMNRRSVVANWQSILFQNKGFVFWSQLQRQHSLMNWSAHILQRELLCPTGFSTFDTTTPPPQTCRRKRAQGREIIFLQDLSPLLACLLIFADWSRTNQSSKSTINRPNI